MKLWKKIERKCGNNNILIDKTGIWNDQLFSETEFVKLIENINKTDKVIKKLNETLGKHKKIDH